MNTNNNKKYRRARWKTCSPLICILLTGLYIDFKVSVIIDNIVINHINIYQYTGTIINELESLDDSCIER